MKGTLQAMSHGKCAYCEARGATEIEHHWPKAPANENANLGTPKRMFRWDNLLPACGTCNAPDRKGSRMEWLGEGVSIRPKLLDPSIPLDDPICYFKIQLTETPAFTLGWMDPHPELSQEGRSRASFTIELLSLNDLDYALQGRKKTLSLLHLLLHALSKSENGPDEKLQTGRTLREEWAELLSARSPHLAPVRQMFRETPNLRNALVHVMPELEAIIDRWDLPPNDCHHVRRRPVK